MIRVRPCTQEDAAHMAALETRAVGFPWSEAQYAEGLAAGNLGLILESDQRMVGHMICMTVLDEAEVLNIVIDRAEQGQGLGTRLLGHGLEQLRQRGIRRVFLEVRESNASARALYLRSGFTESGLRKNYYRSDAGREHAILMEALL